MDCARKFRQYQMFNNLVAGFPFSLLPATNCSAKDEKKLSRIGRIADPHRCNADQDPTCFMPIRIRPQQLQARYSVCKKY